MKPNSIPLRLGLLIASLTAAGCSINEFGVVASERIRADGALVYHLTAPGLHLDTRDKQPSLTLGLYEVAHIFPLACGHFENTAQADSALFKAMAPQLTLSRIIGLQLKAGPGEVSATFGMRELATLISLDGTRDFNRVLKFVPDRPEDTYLRMDIGNSC